MTITHVTPTRSLKNRQAISWETPFLGPMGAAGTMAGGVLGLVIGTILFNAVAGAKPQFAIFAAVTAACGFGVAIVGALAGWALDTWQSRKDETPPAPYTTDVVKAVRPKSV